MDVCTDAVLSRDDNSQCDNLHSIDDYAFDNHRVGASLYVNPVKAMDFITKVLCKAISNISKPLTNTVVMFILQD